MDCFSQEKKKGVGGVGGEEGGEPHHRRGKN